MGDTVSPALDAALQAARVVLGSVRRHRPSYLPSLRLAFALVVSLIDYKLATVPVSAAALEPLQRLLRQISRSAVGVPNWIPRALLVLPLCPGGMGLPDLHLRLLHRRLQVPCKRPSVVAFSLVTSLTD